MHIPVVPSSLVLASLLVALPAHASERTEVQPAGSDEAAAPADAANGAGAINDQTLDAMVYDKEFFARFSPRNALDMVAQLPGFQVREGDGGERGLGQATANVIVNGERLASKSESVRDQIARIPTANVIRIEVVDGATLGIPGLSGQVANIITSATDGFSGQFRWDANGRAHYAKPSFLGGEISIKGTSGAFEYTASLSNGTNRGAAGGIIYLTDGEGTLLEARDNVLTLDGEHPKIAAGFKFDGPGTSVGNFNASYRRNYFNLRDHEARDLVVGEDYDHLVRFRDRGYDYEISGDYEFALGPGRLKLIGLERYERSNFTQTATDSFLSDRPVEGGRYAQTVGSGEHIARGEYSWKMGKADLQLAGEAAFNRLAKDASLFAYDEDGELAEIPFPQGDGGVTEDRYETILTAGYPLATGLTLQTGFGYEYSKISQTGLANTTRSFWRPKGSATLAWAAGGGLDVTLKIARTVGQLNFGDFLARVFLENGNENGLNDDLVPEQSWDSDLTVKKTLGKWGSTQLRLFDRRIEDFIDVIPLEGGGEARGNIDSAKRYGLEWTSTFNLDPVGVRGAKIDLNVIAQTSSLVDPVTGEKRQISGLTRRLVDFTYRHDIPGSDWAYGLDLFHRKGLPYFRVYEWGQENEGPVFAGLFVENKDVLGLTVNARVDNLLGADNSYKRVIYDGPRDEAEVALVEGGSRRIGLLFRMSVKGNF